MHAHITHTLTHTHTPTRTHTLTHAHMHSHTHTQHTHRMLAEGPKLSTIAAAQPSTNVPQQPVPPNPIPPSQPPANVPPPSLPSHPYPSTYHPTTSIATGYSSAPGVLYGTEVSQNHVWWLASYRIAGSVGGELSLAQWCSCDHTVK